MTTTNFIMLVMGISVGLSICMLVMVRGLYQQARRNREVLEELERMQRERQK